MAGRLTTMADVFKKHSNSTLKSWWMISACRSWQANMIEQPIFQLLNFTQNKKFELRSSAKTLKAKSRNWFVQLSSLTKRLTRMKNNIISGLSESRILLSEGAEDFDPSSLTEESPQQSQITNTAIPIAILSLNLSNKTPMFVGGYFQSVTVENEELSIEMVGLLPVGLELVRLSANKPGLTSFGSADGRWAC